MRRSETVTTALAAGNDISATLSALGGRAIIAAVTKTKASGGARDLGRYRRNLQGEVDSAALYRALADAEPDTKLKQIYRRLAGVEEAHAEFWTRRIVGAGGRAGRLRPGLRSRVLAWLARRFGTDTVLPIVNTLERSDVTQYDSQPEAAAAGLPADERSHARIVQALAQPPRGGLSGGELAQLEGRHRGGSNALRAAVLGANDGLVSNLSLIAGVAGANLSSHAVLVTGMAGLIAGACSMAMGEWLSVNSARELAQAQIDVEAEELRTFPEEEKEELALIYQAKGLTEHQAKLLAERIIGDKGAALDTLAREELGIDPNELGGSAWIAAATSFLLFAGGAAMPILPFAVLNGNQAVWAGAALSGAVMFLIGAGTSLFTGRGVFFSGARQLAVGLLAAAVTYGIGRLIGVAISG
ncbi:MAG: VIT1/CCC1 transporter family protein, partial [Alphaproteobacteria bacterium]|nr:VIT1/CCC1 transporter family protein [Alphaproteobacteria bacterium]